VPQTNVNEICPVLLFTLYNKNITYHITEELIFYADTHGDGQFQKFACI